MSGHCISPGTSALLPCPFCNRQLEHDKEIEATRHPKTPYGEYCPLGSFSFASDRTDIINAWNARAGVAQAGWMAIETAPKDGSHVLAIRCDWWEPVNGDHRWVFSRVYETYFDPSSERFEAYGLKQPTHWMPLPAYPVPSTKRGCGDPACGDPNCTYGQGGNKDDLLQKPMCIFCGKRVFGPCASKAMAAGCELPPVTSKDRGGK